MNIWIPNVNTGSGTDVYSKRLAEGLESLGHKVFLQRLPRFTQFLPWAHRFIKPPAAIDVTIANSQYAFAFRRPDTRLIAVTHHCVFDPVYAPFRGPAQSVYHMQLLRRFELASSHCSDAIVAVSLFTAESFRSALNSPPRAGHPQRNRNRFFPARPQPAIA